ncbi:MAG TPA: MFS transporter [candidate division WOR-3 bacterium]|uniref:MFS transporter n=1 Tax=candidate division WOR-3 bacterium TaxID=2052148 RepID=A0A9C9EMB4_UNCW3|nr:MFS transporter [candidate division WOR-3 bacterium]
MVQYLFDKSRSKYERFYFLFRCAGNFAVALSLSINTIFYLSRGLNLEQIGYLSGVSGATILLTEFPTGIFADRYGNALSVVISYFLLSFSCSIIVFANNFFSFIIAIIIGSLGTAFATGSFTAWILATDSGIKKRLSSFYAELGIAMSICKIVGGITGALIYPIIQFAPYLLSSIIYFALGITFLMVSPISSTRLKEKVKAESIKSFFMHAKTTLMFAVKNRGILLILIITVLFICAAMVPFIYWQPLILSKLNTEDIKYLGGVFTLFILCGILGNWVLKKFFARISEYTKLFALFISLGGVALFVTGYFQNAIFSLMAFLVYHFTLGTSSPLRARILNERIPDDMRASVLSFVSWVEAVAQIMFSVIVGFLTRFVNISTLIMLAAFPIVAAFLLALMIPKHNLSNSKTL